MTNSTGTSQDERYAMMTGMPVEALVCRLAVPSIIIMLISGLYNMADTYFVGSLGTSAVAAVGITFPLMAIIQAMGFLFGQGSGNYISRELGARHEERAAKMAATGFFSSAIAGGIFAVLGLCFIQPLAGLLGATPTILPHARAYMGFILAAAPWMAGSLTLNNQLRFQGSSLYGMIGMTSGAILNIFLDPLFIFGFGLGTKGASLATMISQMTGCCVLLALCRRKGNIRIRPRNFSPSLTVYKEILRGGLPSLLRQGLASVSALAINQFARVYGDAAIAAVSIVNRIIMLAGSALLGFGQGFQPVCGFNYGAGRYDRVKRAFWFCVRLSFGIMIVVSALLAVFAPAVIALFRKDDPDVIRIGALTLRFHCISLPVVGWLALSNMMMQTIGKAVQASLLALSRQGLFLLPYLFILIPFLGLLGLQISYPASDITAVLFSIPLTALTLRKMKYPPGKNFHKNSGGD